MKAVVYDKSVLPSKLAHCDVDRPTPEANEVLVKLVCTSINAADYRSLGLGMYPKKKIFGGAIAGEVVELGSEVKSFKIGDNVIADLSDVGFGGFAEYAIAPETTLVKKPDQISFEEASTLPIAATTALKGLREIGNLQNGQSALIVGSTGGVGTFAVQLAKYFGAEVTAVCSSGNLEQTHQLGADEVIDYKAQDFTKLEKRFDLILAINGNESLLSYKRLLSSCGVYVMIGGSMSQILRSIFFGWILSFGSKKMKTLSARSDSKSLKFVASLMEQGHIKAVIDRRYSFDQIPEAMHYVSQGHCPSKVVISM